MTNKDSQFLEARTFTVTDVARIFRVPPHLVGDLTRATFSNIEQQSLDFLVYCMTPWTSRWKASIESSLLLEDEIESFEVDFDMSAMLRGDQQARGQFYHLGITDGWLVRNEAREDDGREPIDGLDEPLVPLNMVQNKDIDTQLTTEPQKPGAAPPVNPNAPDPDAPPAEDDDDDSSVEKKKKQDKKQKKKDNARRFAAMIAGNAARMARRLAGAKPTTLALIAEALAVDVEKVTAKEEAIAAAAKLGEADVAAVLLSIATEDQL